MAVYDEEEAMVALLVSWTAEGKVDVGGISFGNGSWIEVCWRIRRIWRGIVFVISFIRDGWNGWLMRVTCDLHHVTRALRKRGGRAVKRLSTIMTIEMRIWTTLVIFFKRSYVVVGNSQLGSGSKVTSAFASAKGIPALKQTVLESVVQYKVDPNVQNFLEHWAMYCTTNLNFN
jgi:hypothetical protein